MMSVCVCNRLSPPNIGSSGQRLCRSETGAFCPKWRDNREGVSPVPPLPLNHAFGGCLAQQGNESKAQSLCYT
jgi:hypothetical protein